MNVVTPEKDNMVSLLLITVPLLFANTELCMLICIAWYSSIICEFPLRSVLLQKWHFTKSACPLIIEDISRPAAA